MNWLTDHLDSLSLDEDHEGYLLGRGAKEASINRLGLKTWSPLSEASPDATFRSRYGDLGEKLTGWILWPIRCPRGRVIGIAGRRGTQKEITRFLLPEAEWSPIFTGLCSESMKRIWQGSDVWIVEGIFDLFPLEWAVPECDVILGTERAFITNKQVEFLRRFAKGVVKIAYDNDEAGRKGTNGYVGENGKTYRGAYDRLTRVGLQVAKVSYRGKDPGEVWNSGGAPAVCEQFGGF